MRCRFVERIREIAMQNHVAPQRVLKMNIQSMHARIGSVPLWSHCVAIFLIVLYISSAYDHFFTTEFPLKPLYWHLLAVGLAGITILVRSDEVFARYPTAILVWIGVYLGQVLVGFLYSSQTEVNVEYFIYGLETAALLFAFLVLFLPVINSKVITHTLIVVVLFSVCVNYIEFLYPTLSNPVGRAAGWFENANTAGYVMSISMVLSCLAVPRKFRLAYCIIVGTGVLLTFSRSSWILWAIGMIGLSATGKVFSQARLASVFAIGSLSLLVIYALWSGAVLDLFFATGYDQYLDNNTVARLAGGESISQDASINTRIEMVRKSLTEFQQHPWFGAGLGATSEWLTINRPHNLYLMVAVEAGIFGLLVLLALIGILWTNVDSVGRVAVVMYAVSSLFSHNSLEDARLLCLIAIMIAVYKRPKWQPDQLGWSMS